MSTITEQNANVLQGMKEMDSQDAKRYVKENANMTSIVQTTMHALITNVLILVDY
jgi:hypothetical protein